MDKTPYETAETDPETYKVPELIPRLDEKLSNFERIRL